MEFWNLWVDSKWIQIHHFFKIIKTTISNFEEIIQKIKFGKENQKNNQILWPRIQMQSPKIQNIQNEFKMCKRNSKSIHQNQKWRTKMNSKVAQNSKYQIWKAEIKNLNQIYFKIFKNGFQFPQNSKENSQKSKIQTCFDFPPTFWLFWNRIWLFCGFLISFLIFFDYFRTNLIFPPSFWICPRNLQSFFPIFDPYCSSVFLPSFPPSFP